MNTERRYVPPSLLDSQRTPEEEIHRLNLEVEHFKTMALQEHESVHQLGTRLAEAKERIKEWQARCARLEMQLKLADGPDQEAS